MTDWKIINMELAKVRLDVFKRELAACRDERDQQTWQSMIDKTEEEIGNHIQGVV